MFLDPYLNTLAAPDSDHIDWCSNEESVEVGVVGPQGLSVLRRGSVTYLTFS